MKILGINGWTERGHDGGASFLKDLIRNDSNMKGARVSNNHQQYDESRYNALLNRGLEFLEIGELRRRLVNG